MSGLGASPGEGVGYIFSSSLGLLWWLRRHRIRLQCEKSAFSPRAGKIWGRERLPTPVLRPGEFSDCIVHRVAESDMMDSFRFVSLGVVWIWRRWAAHHNAPRKGREELGLEVDRLES